MDFREFDSGTRVRLIKAIPHLKHIRVGWEGEVTEVMQHFVEICWLGHEYKREGNVADTYFVRLRMALSRRDCDNLEVVK